MRINTKRIARLAIFTALALIIHIIEALIPLPIPVPGVKLGLANVVTLFLLFARQGTEEKEADERKTLPPAADAPIVLLCRVFLGAVFSGNLIGFAYSLTGGLLAISAQILLRRFVTSKQIWVCGAFGAVFHNIGQIMIAVFITGTIGIAAYLPVLIIAGIVTGVITGLIAQFAVRRIYREKKATPS